MLEWIRDLCIDTLGFLCGSKSPKDVAFLVVGESTNATIICSANESSLWLIGSSVIKIDTSIPLLWSLQNYTRDMQNSID